MITYSKIANLTLLFILLTLIGFGQNTSATKKTDKHCKPYTAINGFKGAAIVKAKNLPALKSLEAVNECKDGRSYTIMSFDFIAVVNKKKLTYTGTHGDLTPEMKKALGKCKAGSTILFSNIRVKSGDGKFENIQGLTLHVK